MSVFSSSATAGTSGLIRVIDGDTLDVGNTRVRLYGIDAPEAGQTCTKAQGAVWRCGAWVSQTVEARMSGRYAHCERIDTDRYGRMVARCFVDGTDIAEELVAQGLAVAFVRYSNDYVETEKAAAEAQTGLHASRFESPAHYRQARRQDTQAAPAGCQIKGNISSNGTRIYHMPGQRDYDRTRIRGENGERWFCSRAQAEAAGWRVARR